MNGPLVQRQVDKSLRHRDGSAPGKEVKCRPEGAVKMLGLASNLKMRRFACPTLVLVLCVGCSSGLDNQQGGNVGTARKAKRAQAKPRFRNPEMDAMYKAAKASPRSFEPVLAYAKAVTDAGLTSLADTSCRGCGEGAMRYKRTSEIEPHFWPIIEEALSMLETLGKVSGLDAEQVDALVATKGRMLWLAGRSVEEHNLIEDYAQSHPDAPAVIRRRLELLREAGDAASIEAQCARSRAKMESALETARSELLTACVAFHPRNTQGRSDQMDYGKYLPNLSTAEEVAYRNNLVRRCEKTIGDEDARCGEACACEDAEADKPPVPKCKQACGACRNDAAQKLRSCKKINDAPSAVARAPRPTPAPAASSSRPRSTPGHDAPLPKKVDTGKGPKPVEL
jgi:hypothetical protein